MLYKPGTKRAYHLTFYRGYREVLAAVTVIAEVYTIHEILTAMALKRLPKKVAKFYTRVSVEQGAFMKEGL